VTLSAGEHNPTLDAGFVPQLSLGNFVFNDFRNNGIFDAGEDYGIDGIALNLYRYEADGTLTSLESTVTADGGHYLFTDLLPGDYVVELDEQNFALGAKLNQFVSSRYTRDDPSAEPRIDPDTDINNDDNGFSIELPSGGRAIRNQPVTLDYGAEPVNDEDLNPTSNLSVDFGVYDPALGDRIWYDLNRDGIQDAGELGVAGVTLELYIDTNSNNVWDPGDPLLRTTTTNDEGYYRFTFLPPGDYIVRIPPENFGVAGPLYTWNLSPGGADPDTDLNTDSNGLEDGQGGVVALAVTLTSGAEPVDDGDTDEFTNLSVDFGVWRSAASGDRVWYDTDEDGFQDANESGVPGVTAQLYNAQGNLVAEQKTDTNGNYLFENLEPASYSIKFVPPAGYLISPQDAGGTNGNDQYANGGTDDSDVDPATGQTVVTSLGVGETDRTWDLGIYLAEPPATIGDRVWYDTDRDGIQDVGESGVAGVTVQLLNASGAVVATTATNKNGSYLFENLPPGNYAVQFVPPAGYTISPQNAGNTPALDSDVDPATGRTAATPLQTGETDRTWDLGIYLPTEPAAIGERVWFDTHRDGIQNADEKGVAGVIVQLYTAGGVLVAEQRTDGRGDYLFQNLPAGDYYVQFIPPARYSISPQDAEGTNGNDQSSNGGATDSDVDPATRRTVATNLQPGETDRTWDLGIYLAVEPASLGDRVWYDTDKDGVQDYNESGVVGVVVQLYDAAGTLVAETVTDAVGNYRFDNLAPGDYYVRFVPPAGYSISPQAVGSNAAADSDADPNTGKTVLTNLVAQENDPTWDLGIYTQQPPASLGDRVWYDTDKDGVQDAGETGVPGVVVQLYSAAGASVAETRTDANGNYRFENLVPGDYSVQFVPHPAYTVSPQDAGADDGADSDVNPLSGQTVVTNLQAGENDPTWDLGISLDVEPASVSDRVWFDTNRNGVQDPGEAGVAGVGVRLYNEFGNLVAETVADANGGYQFVNLPPGTYQLRFGTRSGYTITNPGTGTGADSDVDPLTGLTAPIVLDPGENDSTWDLGLHLQNTLPASLGDLVWFDEDQDGVQDAAEARVADVMVRLYDAASSLVAQTATDANGNYLFRSLVPGVYFVQFVPPPNYTVTGQNRGAIEEDSDGDSVTGITVPTTLDAGENDLTWDLGIYLVPTALPEGVEPELTRFLYLPVVGNRSGSAVSDVPAAQVGGQSVREESSVVPDAILEENNPTAPAATPVPDFLNQNREPAQQFEIETSAP
jgi:protocatechuate 3,4-dioxygenase beta subunit